MPQNNKNIAKVERTIGIFNDKALTSMQAVN
jgi:hypothetical protein